MKNTDGAGSDITGETGSTYKITASDAGSAFKVAVAFTDNDGYAESITSAATAVLENGGRQAKAIGPRTDVTLVTNRTVSHLSSGVLSTFDQAQEFRTGGESGGYTLRSVTFVITGTAPTLTNITATINEKNASGEPGTSLGTLDTTSNSSNDYTFSNATGIDLVASTSYFVMLDVTGTTVGNVSTASSGNQTSAYDWTIADVSIYRGKDASGSWTDHSDPKRIVIMGTVNRDEDTDATLSALGLVDGDGNAITLSPTLASGTTEYRA